METCQTYTLDLCLAMMTNLRMPSLMSNWMHLFEADYKYVAIEKVHQKLWDELMNVSRQILEQNKTRRKEFQSFNPIYLECAVSI
jgi:hypothetical protein